jgi:L-lactate dehydrogenase complex protein LldE
MATPAEFQGTRLGSEDAVSEHVQLFATCLSENFYPHVLRATVELLEALGKRVGFPEGQICCGQPLFNSGFRKDARAVARAFLEAFRDREGALVAPSGSCVDMVRHHMVELFPPGDSEHDLARATASRTFELSEYLVRVLRVTDVGARFPHRVTYHPSCHQLRGLGLREEAKALLRAVRDIDLVPLEEEEACCGFGGAFSVIYPEVSRAMVEAKVEAIVKTGASAVVACDAGCLMNIAGALQKVGSAIRPLHLIEVLTAERARA